MIKVKNLLTQIEKQDKAILEIQESYETKKIESEQFKLEINTKDWLLGELNEKI